MPSTGNSADVEKPLQDPTLSMNSAFQLSGHPCHSNPANASRDDVNIVSVAVPCLGPHSVLDDESCQCEEGRSTSDNQLHPGAARTTKILCRLPTPSKNSKRSKAFPCFTMKNALIYGAHVAICSAGDVYMFASSRANIFTAELLLEMLWFLRHNEFDATIQSVTVAMPPPTTVDAHVLKELLAS